MSRQSEKFLIGQSRKFLLTAEDWKDGTNRDEPGGTRLAGMAEEGTGRSDHAATRRRKDGSKRSVGTKVAGAYEGRWRRGSSARASEPAIEPAYRRPDTGASRRVSEATGVARLRANVRERATGAAAQNHSEQGNGARMDDGGRALESAVAQARRGAFLAPAAERIRRAGSVGYIQSRLAGGARRSGALSGAGDRRCHQPERGTLRAARRDTREHGRAVEVRGRKRADGGFVHRPGGDVHGDAAGGRKRAAAPGGGPPDAVRSRVARAGNRLDSGALATGQRAARAELRHRPGSSGQASATGQGEDHGGCQQVSDGPVLAGVERTIRATPDRVVGYAPGAHPGDRSGECAEPCGAACGEQRLHIFVCGKEVSGCESGREGGDAGQEHPNRTASERRPESAIRRSVRGSERVRGQVASDETSGESGSQRSQSRRQERLDGRLLRAPRSGVVASGAHGQRKELSGTATDDSQYGTPGKAGPAGFAFKYPKPPLGSFTNSIQSSGTGKPSARNGPVSPGVIERWEGLRRLLSEPTPSHRLWAAAPGATPALRIELTTSGLSRHSKPELSTLLGTGTFYFALTLLPLK